jgi:xanthine dehydrogenase YagR molybdenum-binding subunit
VLAIVTAQNAGKLGKGKLQHRQAARGPEIEHYHQAVALVVAETFEQARAAAQLSRSTTRAQKGQLRPRRPRTRAAVEAERRRRRPETAVGDFAGAFAAAPVQLDATYTTPDQSHAMMEPHATIAAWNGDKLTVWTSNQMIAWGGATWPRRWASQGERPPDVALHRRRLRRQAVRARRRCWPRWARARRGGRSRSRCSAR